MKKVLKVIFYIILAMFIISFVVLSVSTMFEALDQPHRIFGIEDWKSLFDLTTKSTLRLFYVKSFFVSLFFALTLVIVAIVIICKKTPAIKKMTVYIKYRIAQEKTNRKEKKKQKLKEQLNKLESDE